MPSTILGQNGINLPADTTANRPSPSTGMVRYNTTIGCTEFYDGSKWVLTGFPGSNSAYPASSAVQLYNMGMRGKGFFWLSSPNGGTVLNFCDLDTVDQDGVAGWILVAQFNYASSWQSTTRTTRQTINPYDLAINESGQNDEYSRQWSANWGDYTMNRFRIQNSENVNNGGSASENCDWYYHWTNSLKWKEVWSWAYGNYNYINDTTGDNAGNRNASFHSGWPDPSNSNSTNIPRCCLRGFNWAYNLRYSYQVNQRWANLSDSGGGGTAQQSYNYWAGLTTPDVQLQWYPGGTNDGSLAILPSGSTYTTAGQDCATNHAKIGYDDGSEAVLWSSSAGAAQGEVGVTSSRRKAWFWIK